MVRYALRVLRGQPLRLVLTVGGVSLCVVLMFFLLAVYRGAAEGSVDYIRQNPADLWVLQKNASNILRGSSLVSSAQGELLSRLPGVRTVASVLFLLQTVRRGEEARTVFLAGYEPDKGLGGPPRLAAGRHVRSDDEIVLDRSFARKLGLGLGRELDLQGHRLVVVGISRGTNAFVIQYAFVTLRLARSLIGFPGLTTCFLLLLDEGADPVRLQETIRDRCPGLEVYDQATFLGNNVREMKSGFLPLLYTVAAIGVVVLTAILSLLLSVNILERRRDFAILKTLGSPARLLWGMVVHQALWMASASSLVALGIFFPLLRVVERISPEVSAKSSPCQVVGVILAVGLMSLLSALVSTRRLRRIYHWESLP
ncbi:MAG: ABC transporter permease [Candidatus Aminicenantes bacterium]|nr:ABC transporter permease [Candidatus Aminicenantes bacterium]